MDTIAQTTQHSCRQRGFEQLQHVFHDVAALSLSSSSSVQAGHAESTGKVRPDDKVASLRLCRLQGLSRADKKQLLSLLDEQVEANMGMAMVYTLITAIQEHLQHKVPPAAWHLFTHQPVVALNIM